MNLSTILGAMKLVVQLLVWLDDWRVKLQQKEADDAAATAQYTALAATVAAARTYADGSVPNAHGHWRD